MNITKALKAMNEMNIKTISTAIMHCALCIVHYFNTLCNFKKLSSDKSRSSVLPVERCIKSSSESPCSDSRNSLEEGYPCQVGAARTNGVAGTPLKQLVAQNSPLFAGRASP